MSADGSVRGDGRFGLLSLSRVDEAFAQRWQSLADTALEPNPLQDPRFLLTSAQHRDDARALRLAFVEVGSELRAVMVFGARKGFARLPIRMASTVGPFMEQLGDLRHPLLSPEDPVNTWELLLRGLRRSAVPGLLELANFPGEGPLAESLSAATEKLGIAVRERERDERAFARRPSTEGGASDGSSASFFALAHSSSSSRKQRARRLRTLEQEVGAELRFTDLSARPDAVEQFLDLEAAGWKGDPDREGHALRLTGHDAWFAAITSAFRADGKLVVSGLTAGERTIYLAVGFRGGNGLFALLDAYDESFAKHSAGAFGRIAEWKGAFAASDVDFVDPNLSSVYEESTRLYPDRRPHVTLLLAAGGPIASALVRGGPALRRLRSLVSRRNGEDGR